MATITIPKNLIKNDDLIVIPRKEYEKFSEWRTVIKNFKTFIPTSAQKKALLKAEINFQRGKTLSYNELIRKLGFTN